jgi:hypothetical protein
LDIVAEEENGAKKDTSQQVERNLNRLRMDPQMLRLGDLMAEEKNVDISFVQTTLLVSYGMGTFSGAFLIPNFETSVKRFLKDFLRTPDLSGDQDQILIRCGSLEPHQGVKTHVSPVVKRKSTGELFCLEIF